MDRQLTRADLPMSSGHLEVATALRPHPGSRVCGDAAMAAPNRHGALLAVVDGLGHGDGAAEAAEAAVATIRQQVDGGLDEVFQTCHVALRRTRGCVMALAAVSALRPELSWAGVGNVEAAVWAPFGRLRVRLGSRPGIVGYGSATTRAEVIGYGAGDLLVIATDGIALLEALPAAARVADIAAAILEEGVRGDDDALVLVARRHSGAAPAPAAPVEAGG
jgi:negative regulator of sigma-B (phosphoserine phosphatase)